MTMRRESNIELLKKEVAMLPLDPGVYQFLNSEEEVIYVGKAKSLRKRVSSYFVDSAGHSSKVRVMVRQIAEIRHIVVSTEADALLLENNLIKNIRPKYNILLKDDKSYPWIVVRQEPFPRVLSTRKLVRDGSRYFGPYASVTMCNSLLDMIRSVYPVRRCSLNLSQPYIDKGRYSVCLEYHIGNCKGPCVGAQDEQEYIEMIGMIVQILGGNLKPARKYLEKGMKMAASQLKFELAENFRLRLVQLESYSSKSVIVSSTITNVDVFSLIIDQGAAYCNFVRIVSGAVVNAFTAEFSLGADEEPTAILSHAIQQISEQFSGKLAPEVIVPFAPFEDLFPGVAFTIPKRGDKLKLLEFSEKGAKIFRLEKLKNMEIKDPAKHTERIMDGLQKALYMKVQPRHIECFDNSNLQGTNAVAACVVFRDGKPSRKEYRHFNVKTVVGADDFATMREIITRRYTRQIEEGADLPDLIVVDGGKGQLSIACAVLKELGLDKRIAIVGLAERLEEVFFPNDPMPYYLERGGEPLKVMMHIRDEAHRFGITFHRQKRSNNFINSELDAINGLGEVSIAKLLKHFKTVSAIKKASDAELAEVVGEARAKAIKAYFAGL